MQARGVLCLWGLLAAALVCVAPSWAKQYTLNVPRVLLPLVPSSGVRSNFTLRSQQGCFKWTSTKPDVATIAPIYDTNERNGVKCSREAVLTSQSSQPNKLSSIIIAEEQATGQTLRCDVFVDTIARIDITTRTRELLLEEEPERFEVQAFDDEGNTFSTIRGHILEWLLFPDEEAIQQQFEPDAIVNFVPFEESSYETDPVIGDIENRGFHGDTVLVAGVNTGTAKVQARLMDRVWKNVRPSVVKLLVVENIMLQPSMDVYLLPLSFVDYKVERRKHGRTEIVAMPSEQYYLELTNETVGRLDTKRSRVTALVVGYAEAVLQDKNMLHTISATKPTAGIHVIPPHHLGYSIVPGNSWVLEVGREYAITVNVFDKLNHKISVTENVLLATTLPSDFLQSYFSSANGSYHHVKALKPGTTTIHSSLSKIKHPDTGEVHDLPNSVSKQQSLDIYDPVSVHPKQLALLWDPATELNYQHTFMATGGSGVYQWSLDPEGVVSVSSSGTLTTITTGKSLVIAADQKNTAHYDKAEVFVVPPSSLSFLISRVETIVGSDLSLPVQVQGYTDSSKKTLLAFTDCRGLKVEVATTDGSIFNVSVESEADLSTLPQGSCMSLLARAVKPGHTRVTLSYKHKDIFLEDTIAIAAYLPLVPIDPETVAVVTLGSSKDFLFEGGPAPWVLDRSKYFQKLSVEGTDDVRIVPKAAPSVGPPQHVYRVVCRKLGQQTLSLDVGNGPTTKNHLPANETTAAHIACVLPVSMVIRPVVRQMPECPLLRSSNQNIQFPVRSGRHLDLDVVLYDAESRPFDNFTSLQWRWDSSDQALFPTRGVASMAHHDRGAIMTVHLAGLSGSVVVTATSNSHSLQYLNAEKITFKDPFAPGINYSLSLLLRSAPELTPSTLLVFNHPDNQATLDINHGSGHFQVAHTSKSRLPVAEIDYLSDMHQITLKPLNEGQLKVNVNDLCLEVDSPVTCSVYVASVYSIQVTVVDKVQVGNWIVATVRILDNRHMPFPASQYRYMNLQPNPKSSHIEVKPASLDILATLRKDQLSHSAAYVVYGLDVGTTHLLFNATTAGGKVVPSWPVEIQVFDALKLSPKYVTLLPTALFQIRSSGGPMPQTTITYAISNATVATVDDTGLIEALVPGNTTIIGKAQATDASSGHLVTYSEDVVHVGVILLTDIKIFVPSTRLLAGMEVAIHAYSLEDETPFSFGSAIPPIAFHWSATNMDVLSLASVYDRASVSIQEEQDFEARLRTRNPGQGLIRLTAKCPKGVCLPEQATFTDHVQIQVIPALKLLNPVDGHFLLPHNGHVRIVTNRDGVSRMSYQLLQTSGSMDRQELVSVSPQGEVKTGAVNGHAVVMVTAHEEDLGLNQTVTVHVEVRPVTSLSITPVSIAQATPTSKQHAFPLGYSAEFVAQLHDSIGRLFDFAEISLGHRLNRFDIVTVSPGSGNGSYIVKAAKQGNVILKIWVSVLPHISDYVRVRVGYAILPSLATVHLGSKVCFTTHLTEDKPGWWTTGDQGIIQVQPETGVGTALTTGRAVVYHKIRDVIDTHTEITIAKIEEVTFNVTEKNLVTFTNAQRQLELGTYRIPVVFLHGNVDGMFSLVRVSPNPACSDETNKSERGTFIQQVPFECLADLTDSKSLLATQKFIKAEASFDASTGNSYCSIFPIDDPHAIETLSTMEELSLTLRVKAFDFTQTYEIFSERLRVAFVPAFSLSRKSVVLSPSDTATEVTVTGLPNQLQALQAVTSYPFSAVKVSSLGNSATYRISLTDYHSPPQETYTDHKVIFTSNLAHQESTILVSYITDTSEPPVVCVEPEVKPTEEIVQPVDTSYPTPSPLPPITESFILDENVTYFLVILITLLAICIGTLVICLALKQNSSRSQGGFSTHLPKVPMQQAFSPVGGTPQGVPGMRTPSHHTPPYLGHSGGGSAFRKPPSPQHGLFSQ